MKLTKTDTNVTFYAKNGLQVESQCIAIAFYRATGTNPVSINGFPLPENFMFAINQIPGYLDTSQYEVTFGTGGTENALYVFRTIIKEA